MVDLNYDFSMNRLQNRLATFKDWPFTEEAGSSCTAEKVLPLDRRGENKFSFRAIKNTKNVVFDPSYLVGLDYEI